MSRAIVCAVADVHLGNHRRMGGPVEASLNRRCRLSLDVFRAAVARSVELGAAALVVLGDLFDDDHPEPQLIAEVQASLTTAVVGRMAVVLLVGNHDQHSADARDHALGPLAPCATVVSSAQTVVIGRGADAVELGCVPFHPGLATEWLPAAAGALEWRTTDRPRALCIHAGVRDKKTPAWLQDARDAIGADDLVRLARDVGAGVVLAGNWHDRRRWQARGAGGAVDVLQLGALVPTGWDNPGVDGYGTLAVWGDDGAVRHESLPGPRFVRVQSEADLRVQLAFADKRGVQLFVQWEAPPEELADATRRLAGLTEQGKVVAGEVVAGEQKAAEKAWAAAEAARSAGSLEEALGAYVAEMDLPECVDRDDVLSRSRSYLGL